MTKNRKQDETTHRANQTNTRTSSAIADCEQLATDDIGNSGEEGITREEDGSNRLHDKTRSRRATIKEDTCRMAAVAMPST